MSASLDASLAVLGELLDDLAALVAPLDDAALNWAPLPEGTNSIAVLVIHTVGSTRFWLGRAAGSPPPRDRDAEFRARSSAAEILALIDACRADAARLMEPLRGVDLAGERPVRRLRGDVDTAVTAAWCLEHALIHAGEHWGQIQLTAQLYAARASVR